MTKKTKPKSKLKVSIQNRIDPFVAMGSSVAGNSEFWKWGSDNLLPISLALLSRQSTAHRRIINDKADYISGRGFAYDDSEKQILEPLVDNANGSGESLRQVFNKLALDKCLFGNAFCEVVTDRNKSFLSLFHQDASKCRLSKDKKSIILHHDWTGFNLNQAKNLPIFPQFSKYPDGTFRSIIHYKDYEPMFENYGLPPYVAGLNVSAIVYKTDKWNISRLDNSFQLSGIMILNGDVDDDTEAQEIVRRAETQFAGKPGQVMFVVKDGTDDASKFIPVSSNNEGDWKFLHDQATADIVISHSWFRALSGLDYSTGFNSERILHEYEIALNTVILPQQEELLEPIKEAIYSVTGLWAESLQIINKPPIQTKPQYMRIWEARKADGLDYDPDDEQQKQFLSTLNSSKNGTANN